MRSILFMLLALYCAAPLQAQERLLRSEPSHRQLSSGDRDLTPRVVLPDNIGGSAAFARSVAGDMLGSVVGAYAGLSVGAHAGMSEGIAGALVGSVLGSAVGAYHGAHLSRATPSLTKAAIGGMAGGAVAVGTTLLLCSVEFCQGPPIFLLSMPILQGVGAAIGALHH